MPAYLVAIFECHSRAEADAAAESADLGGHAFASVATEIRRVGERATRVQRMPMNWKGEV